MISFATVNETSNDRSETRIRKPSVQKEAQEAKDLKTYEEALNLQFAKKYEEAENIYEKLLQSPLLTQITGTNQQNDTSKSPSALLKYLALKNLASIYERQPEKKVKGLKCYIEASELDGTDVVLWYHMGCLALQLENFTVSRIAFEKGLMVQPRHWFCLEKLIEVLYIIGDLESCNNMIDMALSVDPTYDRGLKLKIEIMKELNTTNKFQLQALILQQQQNEQDVDSALSSESEIDSILDRRRKRQKTETKVQEVQVRKAKLTNFSWYHLGDALIKCYNETIHNKQALLSAPVQIVYDETQFQPKQADAPLPPPEESNPGENSMQPIMKDESSVVDITNDAKEDAPTFLAPAKAGKKAAKDLQPTRQSARKKITMENNRQKQDFLEAELENYLQEFMCIAENAWDDVMEPTDDYNLPADGTPSILNLDDKSETKDPTQKAQKGFPKEESKQIMDMVQHMNKLNAGIVSLMSLYVASFVERNMGESWPKSLCDIVLKIQEALHPHYRMQSNQMPSTYFLTIAEIYLDMSLRDKSKKFLELSTKYLSEVSPLSNDDNQSQSAVLVYNIRLFWLKARHAELTHQLDAATRDFGICQSLFFQMMDQKPSAMDIDGSDGTILLTPDNTISLPYLTNDNKITKDAINAKLNLLSQSQEKLKAADAFNNKRYHEVIQYLSSRLEQPRPQLVVDEPQDEEAEEEVEMLTMLQNSYASIGDTASAIKCVLHILFELVDYAKTESKISEALIRLSDYVEIIKNNETQSGVPKQLMDEVLNTVSKVIQRALYKFEDASLAMQSWSMFFKFMEIRPDGFTLKDHIQLLSYAHEKLGELRMCTHGSFLKQILLFLSKNESKIKEDPELEAMADQELKQCLNCLFGLNAKEIGVESHQTTPLEVTLQNVDPTVMKQIIQFLGSTEANRNVANKILAGLAKIFDAPPDYITPGKDAVLKFLDGTIAADEVDNMYEKPLNVSDENYDFVYQELFALQLHYSPNQIAKGEDEDARSKATNKDVGEKIKDLLQGGNTCLQDLFCNPQRTNSWYNLGLCYRILFDKLLDWGDIALKALQSKTPGTTTLLFVTPHANLPKQDQIEDMIAQMKDKAYRCFYRAVLLNPNLEDSYIELGMLYYSQFRAEKHYLITQYTTHEIDDKFIAEDHYDIIENEQSNFINLNEEPPSPVQAVQLTSRQRHLLTRSLYYFNMALEIDYDNWVTSYMIGKVRHKLQEDPAVYLACYATALSSFLQYDFRKDEAEPVYRLYATILKLVRSGYSDLDLLDKYRFDKARINPADKPLVWEAPQPQQPADAPALTQAEMIVENALAAMKHCTVMYPWFHKSTYQQALQFQDTPSKALGILSSSNIFSGKTTSKQIVKVYRLFPDRGGKIPYYTNRYLTMFLDLSTRVKDINKLETLCTSGQTKTMPFIKTPAAASYVVCLQEYIARAMQQTPSESLDGIDPKDKESNYETTLKRCFQFVKSANQFPELGFSILKLFEDAFSLHCKAANLTIPFQEAKAYCEKKWAKPPRKKKDATAQPGQANPPATPTNPDTPTSTDIPNNAELPNNPETENSTDNMQE